MSQIIWTQQFLLSQGVKVTYNIVHQDNKNKSTMFLEKNTAGSSSRRTWHINIRFFFIQDRITAGDLELQYCPTDEMVGDFLPNRCTDKSSFISESLLWGKKAPDSAELYCVPSKECFGVRIVMIANY
jgi:hypothetical protein